MRRFTLLFAGVVLSVATLTACIGGPPPPPPTDPHNVMVVGDSLANSFGCALGDAAENVDPASCPPQPGYSTVNNQQGGCTIVPGLVLLYNGGTVSQPNCHDWATRWSAWADFYRPNVVVIETGGWEIVDRYTPDHQGGPPDYQWGGSAFQTAYVWYTATLYSAIQMFADKPWHPTVLVSNSVYGAPPEPSPRVQDIPIPELQHAWWEAYPPTAPQQGQPRQPSYESPPETYAFTWTPPPGAGVSYRSSRTKKDQFNDAIQFTKGYITQNRPDINDRVVLFDFQKHFSPGGAYTRYVCPPPDDATVTPQNLPDQHPNAPSPTAWQCAIGGNPAGYPYAILARIPNEDAHLTPQGQEDILGHYLRPCVRELLGLDPATGKCAL